MEAPVRMNSSIMGLLVCGVFMSLANADGLFEGRAVFQSIEVGNDGRTSVHGVSILYGSDELIRGPARQQYPAGNAGLYSSSEGLTGVIPEQTKLHWVTEDDAAHDVTIQTRSLVRDFATFYGFRFYFVDEHVDVYLAEKVPNRSHHLSVKYSKVYSSP